MLLPLPDSKLSIRATPPISRKPAASETVIDSLKLTVEHKVATPANWKQGDDVIIVPAVKDEEAKNLFPDGWKSPKPYIRFVKQSKVN